jgi:NAD(P)-dependent dehydrogenase (short-subunit alcohol dehydrogenase family)
MGLTEPCFKSALVTGASRGIGKAVAERLAAKGYTIALLARDSQDLRDTAALVESKGGKAIPYAVDMADVDRLPACLSQVVADLGSCSLLINNVGMGYTAPLLGTPLVDWQRILALNLTSAFLCIQAVLPTMRQAGGGTIVNVVSIAGKQVFPNWGAYCVSKAGLLALSQVVNQEERAQGIRVTAFCPGAVDTPLWDTVQADFDRAAMLKVSDVADTLVHVALLPPAAVVEELVLMPTRGSF